MNHNALLTFDTNYMFKIKTKETINLGQFNLKQDKFEHISHFVLLSLMLILKKKLSNYH